VKPKVTHKAKPHHRLAADLLVLAKSILGASCHEYSFASLPTSVVNGRHETLSNVKPSVCGERVIGNDDDCRKYVIQDRDRILATDLDDFACRILLRNQWWP
jgi:hypothetical protein